MTAERIALHLSVAKAHRGNAFEDPHQLLGGVGVEPEFGFQIGFEVHYEVLVDLAEQDISLPVANFQELLKPPESQVVFVEGRLSDVDPDELLLSIVELLEDFEQRVILGIVAEKGVAQHRSRNDLVRFGQALVMGDKLSFDTVEVTIYLDGLFGLADGFTGLRIPEFCRDFDLEVEADFVTVQSKARVDGNFAVGFPELPPHEKENSEGASHAVFLSFS